ncbi:MAG TPA: LytTR family transcriptional regulator DNA-binding domain-containing protein [Kofleriaceae bacterium]|nr:LytTR family transcriptional regulator DNA-binding domain-containing protein [Kofleriaceae bacterium]
MNVVVIEDEAPSADKLTDLLAEVAPAARVVAQLRSVDEAARWLAAHPIDLVFADIELQDGRVFDALAGCAAPVIFTTAYDRFVLEAFRAQGIAYLLKPFGAAELAAALAKHAQLRRGFVDADRDALDDALAREAPRRHFTVKARQRIRILPVERVALIALGKAGVELLDHEGHGHGLASELSLAEIERGLPARQFFRINRTEIVALDAIDYLDPASSDRIVVALKRGRSCIVAGHRAAAFRRWLGL